MAQANGVSLAELRLVMGNDTDDGLFFTIKDLVLEGVLSDLYLSTFQLLYIPP